MASTRRHTFVGAALVVVTSACVAWAGWTIYRAMSGPKRAPIKQTSVESSPENYWRRRRKPAPETHVTPDPAHRKLQGAGERPK
jgi:hypothetical protein